MSVIELSPYRLEALEYIVAKAVQTRGLFLYNVMGTGKTITALMFLQNFLDMHVIFLVPAVLQFVWKAECQKFAAQGIRLPKKQTFVTYDTLLHASTRSKFDGKCVMIADEIHHLSHLLGAQKSQEVVMKVMNMLRMPKKSLLLSGTPFPTEIADIRYPINLLLPTMNAQVPLDHDDFRQRFYYSTTINNLIYKWRLSLRNIGIKGQRAHGLFLMTSMQLAAAIASGLVVVKLTDPERRFFQDNGNFSKLIGGVAVSQIVIGYGVVKSVRTLLEKADYESFRAESLTRIMQPFMSYHMPPVLDVRNDSNTGGTQKYASLRKIDKPVMYSKDQTFMYWRLTLGEKHFSSSDRKLTGMTKMKHRDAAGLVQMKQIKTFGLKIGNLLTPPKFHQLMAEYSKVAVPTVVYSQFQRRGIELFETYLKDKHREVPYRVVYNGGQVEDATAWFRGLNGQGGMLLLGKNYYEGISILGARALHILEPIIQQDKFLQLAGRVRRYQSHSHLPEDQRNVILFQWRCVQNRDMYKYMEQFIALDPKKNNRVAFVHIDAANMPDEYAWMQIKRTKREEKQLDFANNNITHMSNLQHQCCIWKPNGVEQPCPVSTPCAQLYQTYCATRKG